MLLNYVVLNKIIWIDKKNKVALLYEDNVYIWKVNYDKIEEYIEKVVDDEENAENDECKKAFGEPLYIDGKLLRVFSLIIF